MRGLNGRLAKLETKSDGGDLSLVVRAWLGHPLSLIEGLQATGEAQRTLSDIDWSKVSKEAREWLQA